MDETRLRYFVSAAYSLNFSEVARDNYISQPTISHQIELLERELGVKLFLRNGKKLALTSEGEYFLPLATKLLEDISQATASLQQYGAGNRSKLDIMISETSASAFRELLPEFSKRYPDIILDVRALGTVEQFEAILRDRYDIYFTFEKIVRAHEQYDYFKIGPDGLCLVLPPDAPVPEDMNDFSCLANYPYVGLISSVSAFLRDDIAQVLKHRNFTPKTVNCYDNLQMIVSVVALGIGFTIMPHAIAKTAGDKVRCIPLDDDCGKTDIILAWDRDNRNKAVELFVSVAREMFG